MSSEDNNNGSRAAPDEEEVPYTITQEGNDLHVEFTSGPMQGDNFRIDARRIAAARARETARTTQSEDPPEEELPAHSFHAGDGRQISEEEYNRLAVLEREEAERQKAEKSAKKGGKKKSG